MPTSQYGQQIEYNTRFSEARYPGLLLRTPNIIHPSGSSATRARTTRHLEAAGDTLYDVGDSIEVI